MHGLAVEVQGQGGHRLVGEERATRTERPEKRLLVQAQQAVAPSVVGALEQGQGRPGRIRQRWPAPLVEHVTVAILGAEEGIGPGGEDVDGDVVETPGDRGDRRRVRLRDATAVHLQDTRGGPAHRPGSLDRLPVVLVVGQALQTWPEAVLEIEAELVVGDGAYPIHGCGSSSRLRQFPSVSGGARAPIAPARRSRRAGRPGRRGPPGARCGRS